MVTLVSHMSQSATVRKKHYGARKAAAARPNRPAAPLKADDFAMTRPAAGNTADGCTAGRVAEHEA